jgi:hypothetical protein
MFFFVDVLDSNMYVYVSVTCWDKKTCFRSQKCPFMGWKVAAFAGFFYGFMCIVLRVLRKNIALDP